MKKRISILLVLAMVLSLIPMMAFANTAGSITATSVPVVTRTTGQNLGAIRMVVPAGARTAGQRLTIDLPSGVLLPGTSSTDAAFTSNITAQVPGANNGLAGVTATVYRASSRKIEVILNQNVNFVDDGLVVITLNNMNTTDASAGDITATVSASPNSGYPTGNVVVGRVATGASVALSTASRKTRLDGFTFHLDVKEDTPGSLAPATRTVRLRLPDGYEWSYAADANTGALLINPRFGPAFTATGDVSANGRDLTLNFNTVGSTNDIASFRIEDLAFRVADETKVRDGEIEVAVSSSGNLSRNVSRLAVGTRADFGVTIEMDEVEEIKSGRTAQEIGDIIVKELIGNSLIANRTIALHLPSEARWAASSFTVDNKEGVVATAQRANNARILNITVAAGAASVTAADTLTIEDATIIVEPGFEGDIVVEILGSQGLRGEMKVATAVKPVKVEAVSNTTTLVIGRSDQEVASFTIAEISEEALRTGVLDLALPTGFGWSKVPTVKVVEGDVNLGTARIVPNTNLVRIPVNAQSFNAATIEVTNVELTVYRTVPEGTVEVKVRGAAVVDDLTATWQDSLDVASLTVATVGTPAQGQDGKFETVRQPVTFTIGQNSYKVGDEVVVADATPFIQNSRTMVPVRFIAQAVGVPEANIVWDANARTVTIFGERIIQLEIGSRDLLVNGARVAMDTEAVIVNDRTFVPIAWIAQALAVEYTWNAADMSVTFK